MAVFEWNQFNSSGAKISRYVQGFRCRTTNIVAYYIPNKHNINIDFEFDGEFEPLGQINTVLDNIVVSCYYEANFTRSLLHNQGAVI